MRQGVFIYPVYDMVLIWDPTYISTTALRNLPLDEPQDDGGRQQRTPVGHPPGPGHSAEQQQRHRGREDQRGLLQVAYQPVCLLYLSDHSIESIVERNTKGDKGGGSCCSSNTQMQVTVVTCKCGGGRVPQLAVRGGHNFVL